ncbi:MAG TPA: hypothetical protein VKB35_16465 [Ktedonobacteraceae bacterium]|nr:hypothetical protein [Ktedonobacteraceae bacterium]
MRLRDALGPIYQDEAFASRFPKAQSQREQVQQQVGRAVRKASQRSVGAKDRTSAASPSR